MFCASEVYIEYTLCWSCHILAHKDIVLFFLKANECDCFPSFFLQQFNILGSLGTNYTSEGQLRNSFQPRQLTCTAKLFAEKKFKLRLEIHLSSEMEPWWWFRIWQRTSENRNSDNLGPFQYKEVCQSFFALHRIFFSAK